MQSGMAKTESRQWASDAEGCRRRRQYRTGRAHHGATAREGMSEANL